jgi:hypothetical protein
MCRIQLFPAGTKRQIFTTSRLLKKALATGLPA